MDRTGYSEVTPCACQNSRSGEDPLSNSFRVPMRRHRSGTGWSVRRRDACLRRSACHGLRSHGQSGAKISDGRTGWPQYNAQRAVGALCHAIWRTRATDGAVDPRMAAAGASRFLPGTRRGDFRRLERPGFSQKFQGLAVVASLAGPSRPAWGLYCAATFIPGFCG
jgi:hypothetical protein